MKRPFNLCSAALALLLFLGALPAQAATYVVTNLNDSGAGSLRAAVESAVRTTADDTITFLVNGTIVLQSVLNFGFPHGSPGSLLIDGTGQSITISGNNAVPVLTDKHGLRAGQTLTLKALTIVNGKVSVGDSDAVVNATASNLEIVNCVFSGNTAFGNATPGVVNVGNNTGNGTLSIANSRFMGNDLSGASGASVVSALLTTTTITNSSFESNSGNVAAVAVVTGPNAPNVRLTVTGSTFTGNSNSSSSLAGEAAEGGALRIRVPATIANSTFHGNSSGNLGGAIAAQAPVTVTNSTFSDNRSGAGGALALSARSGSALTLRNSIVANSSGGNCGAGVADGGGNLSDDLSCGFTEPSSLNGTAAQLGPLQDNGGPTKTMMPLTGSPAIDQGVNTLALDAAGVALTTDQRGSGFARISPTGGTVDRGAVEVLPPPLALACPANTARVGTPYSAALLATGGKPPYSYASVGSLPAWLRLAGGTLSGTPTAAGSFLITLQVNDGGFRITSQVCSINVSPAAAALSVTPTSLDFGTLQRYSGRLHTVTLKNTGTSAVTLGRVSVKPNPGTSEYVFTPLNLCPSSLAAGKSCTVSIVFFANEPGAKAATLNLPNSAAGSPQGVALSANVLAR